MGNPAVHWEICAKNPQKAVEFYGKLFDWDIEYMDNLNYWMCNVSKGGIGGGIFKAEGEMPSYVTIYIKVDDVQATYTGLQTSWHPDVCREFYLDLMNDRPYA